MSEIQISTTSQQAISLFISVGIPALVLLFFALLGVVGSTEFVARVRAVPSKIRQYVDDPNDPVIMLLDLLADKLTQRDVDAQTLIDAIQAVLNGVDNKLTAPIVTTTTTTTTVDAPVAQPETITQWSETPFPLSEDSLDMLARPAMADTPPKPAETL